MNVSTICGSLAVTIMSLPGLAFAQTSAVVIDGAADAAYGDAVALQDTNTEFGDASTGLPNFCNGSEIDGLYVLVEDGYLHLLIAGNLEDNFNKLEIFVDSIPGEGQNPILGNNPDIDFNALATMGEYVDPETGEVQPGLTFDAAFVPDFWMTFTGGAVGPETARVYDTYCSYSRLLTGGGSEADAGGAGPGTSGPEGALVLDNGIEAAIDNSNIDGVIGGPDLNVDGGAGVSTGIEIAIPLTVLDYNAGDDIGVSVMVNGSGHDFLSNQVIGGLGGSGNLGFPRFVNLDVIPGDQFVTVAGEGGGGEDDCPADFDGNGVVNGADFGSLLAKWGVCGECQEDLDNDQQVSGSDVGAFLAAWGECPESDEGCGDCDVVRSNSLGCSDTECQDAICADDIFCCTIGWDSSCVSKATSGNYAECDCP